MALALNASGNVRSLLARLKLGIGIGIGIGIRFDFGLFVVEGIDCKGCKVSTCMYAK